MTHVGHVPMVNRLATAHQLNAAAWGLFFVWAGVAIMTNLGWGVGLIGVGVITLVGQVARRYIGESVELFWVGLGLFFILGGVWELLGLQFSLVPIMLIVAGLALLFSAIRPQRS